MQGVTPHGKSEVQAKQSLRSLGHVYTHSIHDICTRTRAIVSDNRDGHTLSPHRRATAVIYLAAIEKNVTNIRIIGQLEALDAGIEIR